MFERLKDDEDKKIGEQKVSRLNKNFIIVCK
jgi:hypothetical protein